jgi:hypothetical protein
MSGNSVRDERFGGAASARATTGGVGLGTGAIALGSAVGPNHLIGGLLTYSAPALSWIVRYLWLFIEIQVIEWVGRREIHRARATLKEQLANDLLTDDRRGELMEKLWKIEQIVSDSALERVVALNLTHRLDDLAVQPRHRTDSSAPLVSEQAGQQSG